MKDGFQLDIRVQIQRCGPNGYPNGTDRLSVDENMTVPAGSFMEVAAILGQFHELAERIRAEQAQE